MEDLDRQIKEIIFELTKLQEMPIEYKRLELMLQLAWVLTEAIQERAGLRASPRN